MKTARWFKVSNLYFNQGTVGEENNQLLPYKYGGENCG